MAWYKEWFGEDYLELYAHRDADEADAHVDFVTDHLGAKPGAVLDLACGAGRHTAALRQRGYRALGVDLSVTLLAHPPRQPCVAGDMRRLPFRPRSFDWILNFFTSFGYFESERENFQVLEEIVRLLNPGGWFLIDFLNRDYVLDRLEPREERHNGDRQVEIARWYDTTTRRINKRIRVEVAGRPPRTYLESVRAYDRDEVTGGLRAAGLRVHRLFGNFQGDPLDSDSERLIIIGRTAA